MAGVVGASGITRGPDGALWFTDVFAQKIGRVTSAARVRRTAILNPLTAYYINGEEVRRAAKIVTSAHKRSRWLDGATITWKGRRVTTGKGEGSSGLAFDQVADIAPTTG
jgi:streptogramin lyase